MHAFFCARGVPDFRKFCKFIARFLRKVCGISTLDSRINLHSNARRLYKELQRCSAVRATTLAESTQLCARGAPKIFGNFEISFARVRRKTCVIPTPDAFFFGSECNYDSINSQRRCGVCTAHAGRVHAIFVRGACRISGNFANFSREFLRKICFISTLDSRVNLHCNARRLGKELKRNSLVRETTLAEFTQLLCARRAKIFRDLRIFSREFCAKFASSRRWTLALSCIRMQTNLKKSCNDVLSFPKPRWPSSRNFCARGAPIFFGNFAILSRELGAKFA